MGISFRQHGHWNKTEMWLRRNEHISIKDIVEPYAEQGLNALKNATPVDSGKTRDSWYYTIDDGTPGVTKISWCNKNNNKGLNIAVLIQYGHGTKNGAYVQGINYINPALKPTFNALSQNAYKEVIATYGN